MSRVDPYRLLGVSRDASLEELRAAFRNKVRQQHPDTASEESDDTDVQDVIEAYRLLMNRARREPESSRSSSGGRRIHVKRGSRSGRKEAEQRPVNCHRCGGTGMERIDMVCPDCDGRAEITALAEFSARIVRCRRCRGEGRLRSSTTCRACGGSGAAAG